MIEVITHAEFLIKVDTENRYEQIITDQLQGLDGKVIVDKIIMISSPQLTGDSRTLQSDVLATFILTIPEADPNKPVEEYTEEIMPFLKRHLPNCMNLISTKIMQIKRIRQE
ncbi:hypothetical protein [Bacillus marinisedimentorum]|uniref:hypothetical protein n=1 Tax=Bacillus marinisedimentorum TaxID=1821260 RepID=UPI0007DF4D97|nr:hypothetical protein [Bacillus marinisedimentorum]